MTTQELSTLDTLDLNKRIAVGWLDQVSDGDLEEMLRTTAPDWRMHGGPPNLPAGPEGVRTLFGHFGQITQKWTIEDVIAEGDRVVVRGTNTGEQDSFMGIPASGIQQTFTATFTFRIADGMVREIWRNADDLGRLLQIGATFSK